MSESSSKCQQLYNELKRQIEEGHLVSGEKLPSESELIESYHISRYGVRKAMSLLIKAHLLTAHQGKGYFVTDPPAFGSNAPSGEFLVIASRIERSYFSKAITGIQSYIANTGYAITIKLSNYNVEEERQFLTDAIQKQNYAGIFLFPSDSAYLYTNHFLYRDLVQHKIPCIVIGNKLPFIGIPSVTSDDFLGGQTVARYLLSKGHYSVCCLMNREEYSACMRFSGLEGAYYSDIKEKTSVYPIWYNHTDVEKDLSGSLKQQILDVASSVSAFFCFNDSMAFLLIQFLKVSGYNVPENISVVGYDDSEGSSAEIPPLTTIHQDPEKMGFQAARNMMSLIRNPRYNANSLFTPYLVERSSVADLLRQEH